MNNLSIILVVFGLTLTLISVVNGLKCYQCPPNCDTDDQSSVNCMGGICIKTIKDDIITRSCSKTGRTPGCSITNNQKICACKDKDLCNGSKTSAAMSALIFISVLLIHRIL